MQLSCLNADKLNVKVMGEIINVFCVLPFYMYMKRGSVCVSFYNQFSVLFQIERSCARDDANTELSKNFDF